MTPVPDQEERQRQRTKALVKARQAKEKLHRKSKVDAQLADVRRLNEIDKQIPALQARYFASLEAVVASEDVRLLDACDRAYQALMNASQFSKRLREQLGAEPTPMRQRVEDLEDQAARKLAQRMAAAGRNAAEEAIAS